jgi:hypothetical protein
MRTQARGLVAAVVGVLAALGMAGAIGSVGHVARSEAAGPAQGDLGDWLASLTYRTYGRTDFGLQNRSGSRFGAALALGDFDNDGTADLVVGAPNDNPGGTDSGWFGVAFGGSSPFAANTYSSPGDQAAGQWGARFAVGDLNADGYDDLAIGVPRRDFGSMQDSGTVWLLDGFGGGLGRLSRPIRNVGQVGALDGAAVVVGDFDGDGTSDLAVGTPQLRVVGYSNAGQVTMMRGRVSAGPVTDGQFIVDRSVEDVPGEIAGQQRLGQALAAGDFDGDGTTDLAIGVPGATVSDQPDAGAILVVYGGTDAETGAITPYRMDAIDRSMPEVMGSAERSAAFGESLLAADLDGDGFMDLVVAAPGATVGGRQNAGELVVARGTAAGLDFSPWATIQLGAELGLNPAAGDRFGTVLSRADVTGDGSDELLVGLPGRSVGTASGAGTVVLLSLDVAGATFRGTVLAAGSPALGAAAANRQAFGAAIQAGDFNGDGNLDLAIGAPGQPVDGLTEAGAVVIGWGGDDLPDVPTATAPPSTSTPTPSATATPRNTATPRPVHSYFIPWAGRLGFLDRYPPLPQRDGSIHRGTIR